MIDDLLGIENLTLKIIDKFIPDPKQKPEATLKLQEMQQNGELSLLTKELQLTTLASNNIKAEIEGQSAVQRNWRPHFMYVLMANMSLITFYNYIVYPFMHIWIISFPYLEMPSYMWQTIMVGMGGYIATRSAEKITQTVMNNKIMKDK